MSNNRCGFGICRGIQSGLGRNQRSGTSRDNERQNGCGLLGRDRDENRYERDRDNSCGCERDTRGGDRYEREGSCGCRENRENDGRYDRGRENACDACDGNRRNAVDYAREENMECGCDDCRALFNRIQAVDFAIVETVLYLDVYPCSKEALNYYHDLKKERERLMKAYEDKCAAITMHGNESCEAWNWISSPWPWEAEANK